MSIHAAVWFAGRKLFHKSDPSVRALCAIRDMSFCTRRKICAGSPHSRTTMCQLLSRGGMAASFLVALFN